MHSVMLVTPVTGESFVQRNETPVPALLFEDNFTTYSGRWEVTESPKSLVAYADERLHFMIVAPGVSVWSVPDFNTQLHDYHIEVSAYIVNGEANAQYGVLLDYQDDETFYTVLVALTGEWQFLHYYDGEWVDLTPHDPMVIDWPDDAPDEPVRLAVDVIGDIVTLEVNDQILDPITVSEALTGTVFGLIARAERGYITVDFDDLTVSVQTGVNQK